MVAFRDAVEVEPLRVHVAASDPLVRAGLSALLGRLASIGVQSAAAEVVLWDAADVARGLPVPGRPTLALVGGPESAQRALAVGATGVLRRDAKDEAIAAALSAIREGLVVLDPEFHPSPKRADALLEPLTAREREVLVLLAEGCSNKEIAQRLGISEHTAKFHVNAILQKLSADRRTDAVVRAARLGLITL